MSLTAPSNNKQENPQHVAIIMDGNGRWATQKSQIRTFGHRHAIARIREIVEASCEYGISVLTLFAWGRENWQRPDHEVKTLMELFVQCLHDEIDQLDVNGVVFRMIGDRTRLSPRIIKLIEKAEHKTSKNKGLVLNIAMDYSGRWDINQALKKLLVAKAADADGAFDSIAPYLSTESLPEVDFLIRTSGESRISNFFLWQLAYAELYFTDTLFPDFGREAFDKSLAYFKTRQRRFGKLQSTGKLMGGVLC